LEFLLCDFFSEILVVEGYLPIATTQFRLELFRRLFNETNFVGVTPGTVKFDKYGDRVLPYAIKFFDQNNNLQTVRIKNNV
jgi:hypothetical protein